MLTFLVKINANKYLLKIQVAKEELRWQRNKTGQEQDFLPHKFIKRTFEHSELHKTTSDH